MTFCKALKPMFFIFFLLLTTQTLFAQTFNVSTTPKFRQALLDAAGNGQSDTIVLADGTYKTTDDGGGTFAFLDNENYDLTIQGSSAENVVLDGDNTNRVLKLHGKTKMANVTISNGSSDLNGGGLYASSSLNIKNCIIIGNTANVSDGGGFYCNYKVEIVNSLIINNYASYSGGGFYSRYGSTVINSLIHNNEARWGGGAKSAQGTRIENSIISSNKAREHGAGLKTFGATKIVNCLIINNSDSYSVYCSSTMPYITNSVFTGNYLDIGGDAGLVTTIHNSYIDETKLNISTFSDNNIFGGNLNFVDPDNGNYHIGPNSVLINAGTTEDIFLPITDMDGNQRVSGATIDIGPYELSSTRPTINSFINTGVLKIGETISFATDATPSDGRTIQTYEIDFGDGAYQEVASSTQHIFNNPGVHDITVKVTDSENEYSTQTITLSISDLSLEEKLTTEFEKGKQQVIDNYTQFGFVTTSEKEKAVTDAEAAKDAVITQKDNTIAGLNTTIESMFTQEQLDQAVLTEKEKWDQNGDGKYGLPEAIKALQITSGTDQD